MAAEVRLAAQAITSFEFCLLDENGEPTNDCVKQDLATTPESVKLVMNYALIKSETHAPKVETVAGLLKKEECTTTAGDTLPNKPGVRLFAYGASYQGGTSFEIQLNGAGQSQTVKIPQSQSPKQSVPGVGGSLCLL